MDGNMLETRADLNRWSRVPVAVLSFAFFVGPVSATVPPTQDTSRHRPEPLLVDELVSQPIESSRIDARVGVVRPHGRVLSVGRSSGTATLLVATSDAENAGEGHPNDTPRPIPKHESVPVDQGSTWLRMQAEKSRPASQARGDNDGVSGSQTEDRPATSTTLSPPTTIDEALDRRGSISFRKTPISEVVFLLSDLWKINIVAGENVSGEVSGTFHEAPLREVLSAVLTASGYSYQRTGRSLVVLPIDEVGSDDPNFIAETLRLPVGAVDEAEILEAAQLLLSERGEIRKLGNDLVLVVDTRDRIERVRTLYRQLTPVQNTSTPDATDLTSRASGEPANIVSGIAYFSPQYTEASEMAESLTTALGDDAVVAVYSEENRIMVKGRSDILHLASEAIEQLDVPRAQVRITAMIYDVGLNELERLGVDWSQGPHSASVRALSPSDDTLVFRNSVTASTGLISDPTVAGATNFAVRTLSDTYDAGLLLQALNSNAESKLLADPSITVGDRREASIRIVQKIPILAADPVENSGVVFSQVQFEDAGVILNVTPRISRDGTIEMQVQPEYSVVVDFIENNPVIDSRTAQTTLRVQDGHMFALGGLRQKTITETIRGVPFLKDMKHFGKLFRAHESQVRESELIVFIKPEIVVPCSLGSPRQERARCVSGCQLDQIPHATQTPQTPYCGNVNCPNHVPRPRVNSGSRALQTHESVSYPNEVSQIENMPSPSDVTAALQDQDADVVQEKSTFDEETYLRLRRELHQMESDAAGLQLEDVVLEEEVWPHVPRVPLPTASHRE